MNEDLTEEVRLEYFSINHAASMAICVFGCLHVTHFNVPSAFFSPKVSVMAGGMKFYIIK